jgi:hypothetical protein
VGFVVAKVDLGQVFSENFGDDGEFSFYAPFLSHVTETGTIGSLSA